MKYAITFLVLAIVSLFGAWTYRERVGVVSLASLYLALSLLTLAIAYAGVGPRLMFKRDDGNRSPIGWAILAPYIGLNAAIFAVYRRVTREPAYVRVAPNLFFGRRLTARETTEGWTSVLDLAGEFVEPWPHRDLPGYRSLPLLDATAPTEPELRAAVAWIAESMTRGPVYVHCALGHGRSASVVIAYLLTVGEITTVEEGIHRLRSLRPGVRLDATQVRRLRTFRPDQSPTAMS